MARQFSSQDFLDLQVWFNLAWFGYGAVQRYPRLAALRAKNRGFTEEEKQEVLALQRQTVQDIVPMYRRLAERGQIELTTTPFLSSDPPTGDRYGAYPPGQAGSAAAFTLSCAGRCRGPAASGC